MIRENSIHAPPLPQVKPPKPADLGAGLPKPVKTMGGGVAMPKGGGFGGFSKPPQFEGFKK